jgi:hypothetical protein
VDGKKHDARKLLGIKDGKKLIPVTMMAVTLRRPSRRSNRKTSCSPREQ